MRVGFLNVMRGRTVLLVLLCAGLAACGARSSEGNPRANRNIITEVEIASSSHTDAYALLQSMRPQWLRARGTSSLNAPASIRVYLDGSMLGGVEHLRQITTRSLGEIRFLDGLEATQRWGLDHGAGAIMLTTRR